MMHRAGVGRESTKRRIRSSRLSDAAFARFRAEAGGVGLVSPSKPRMHECFSCSNRCCGPSRCCTCLEKRGTFSFAQEQPETPAKETLAQTFSDASRESKKLTKKKSFSPKVRVISSTRTMRKGRDSERPSSPLSLMSQPSLPDVSEAGARSPGPESVFARAKRAIARLFARPRPNEFHHYDLSPSMRFSETRPVELEAKPQVRTRSSTLSTGLGWRKIVHAERPWPGAKPSTLGQAKAMLLHHHDDP